MIEKSLCTDDTFTVSAADAFERYAQMVYKIAFTRTGNKSDADDILQEVFLRFMRSKPAVNSEEHLKALLVRMTINCSKSFFTSAWNRKTVALDETLPGGGIPQNDTLDAVMRLDVKHRTVIHLYYYCGYSVSEIAEILQNSSSAVKSRLMRARDKLKEGGL